MPNGVGWAMEKRTRTHRPTDVLIVGRNSGLRARNKDALTLGSSGPLASGERYTGAWGWGGNSNAASSDPIAGLGSSTAFPQQLVTPAADVATSHM